MTKSVTQVQGTNDYSSVSKCSMVERGYFEDGFIKLFVEKSSRRSPLINVGYCVRAKIVDFVFEKFLGEVAEQPAQIISFGAGFDTSFFRLLGCGRLHPEVTYYEVDFREVVERKAAIIQASDDLLQAVGDFHSSNESFVGVVLRSNRYCLIGCDLQDLEGLENVLRGSGTDFSLPTLCLAECSITYMDETRSTALIGWAASKFERGIFATYEQVFPHDAFGIVMAEHFRSLNSPLLSVDTFPDLDSQEKRYEAQGWPACVARSVLDVFMHTTDHEERFRVFTLEPFDEFEELHLKCLHYALTVAARDPRNRLLSEVRSVPGAPGRGVGVGGSDGAWTSDGVGRDLWRFCHRTARLGRGDGCLVVGGVGVSPEGKHRRRAEACWLAAGAPSAAGVRWPPGARLDVMQHTVTPLADGRVLLLGGRTAPSRAANPEPVLLAPGDAPMLDAQVVGLGLEGESSVWKPRWRHTATVASVKGHCRVLVFGGRTPSLEVLDDLWVLDVPAGNSARRVMPVGSAPWPGARCSHSATAIGASRVVVAGGLGARLSPLSDVWQLDVDAEAWSRHSVVMLPRYGHTAHCAGGRLVLVGGVGTLAGRQPGVAVIDTAHWTCVEYALPVSMLRIQVIH
ncbi:tRNA wybutosine-synthesizing protein 4-like isoform X2 [Bacillus rossius redtenbacheri]|uniref:tRNA wybutosine-synthesizing protein 4-like isoform X2 n=1 Tax=Bacillus rossius redtenbacheri TaxID=93214 RepID=UPI002FDE31D4